MEKVILKIGPYGLNQPISDYPTARKVSFLDRMLGSTWPSSGKLPGEIHYKDEKIEFMETKWSVRLGVYQNRIIRISAGWVINSGGKEVMEKKVCELVQYCEQRFEWNNPDCSRKDIKTWQTPLGVISVNVGEMTNGGRPMFFMVSLEAIASSFAG